MPALKYNFVPVGLDPSSLNSILLDSSRKNKSQTNKNVKSELAIITHKAMSFYSLMVKKITNKIFFEQEGDQHQYVYLNKNERRCLLGDDYVNITEKLVKAGLLIENPDYHYNELGKNTYTKSYAIPSHLFSGDRIFKRVEIAPVKSIQKMIGRFNDLRLKGSECDMWREEMIRSSERIMIHDNPESRSAVQEHIDKINQSNSNYHLNLRAEDIIDLFNNSAINQFNVDPFGKRVHNKITRLPKKIRQFLYFEGNKNKVLGCVDIVNSQPLFMSAATPDLLNKFTPELTEAIAIVKKFDGNPDIKRFNEHCGNGRIYESIMEHFEHKNITIDRDQAKIVCYTCFFGNYFAFEFGNIKDEFKNMAYEFLQQEYGGLYNQFKEMKVGIWQESNKKLYANNCMLAQRLESQVFFQVIVPALWKAGYKDISTIHDSIICYEEDMDAIKEIMLAEFQKLGIILKLTAKSTLLPE